MGTGKTTNLCKTIEKYSKKAKKMKKCAKKKKPPLSKGGGRACEAGGIPAALPFCLSYPFTSFTSFSPLANARAFSIVVMAMLCNAVRVKNA